MLDKQRRHAVFWDRAAIFYDLFGYIYNGKVNKRLCAAVSELIAGGDRVLECACGTGMISAAVAAKCRELTATDSEGMLKRAKKRLKRFDNAKICFADITKLGFDDESFDAVIAANVIHLLDEPRSALSELSRVCKKGGKLIIPTYIGREGSKSGRAFVRSAAKAGAGFKRQFTLETYRALFEESGFSNVRIIEIAGRVPCAVAALVNCR